MSKVLELYIGIIQACELLGDALHTFNLFSLMIYSIRLLLNLG
jgi:hypothetical protein